MSLAARLRSGAFVGPSRPPGCAALASDPSQLSAGADPSPLPATGRGFARLLRARPPAWVWGLGLVAVVIQLNPAWRNTLLYDRGALERGEVWRAWTGHWVHFGWAHLIADGALFLILGALLEPQHQRFARLSAVVMPPFISAAIYVFDPSMERYGGLSALNLGLLLYYAAQGWRRDLTDCFWPAVLLIYVAEVALEIGQGGRGGGMIAFDDTTVRVATSAHLAAGAYAGLALLVSRWASRRTAA